MSKRFTINNEDGSWAEYQAVFNPAAFTQPVGSGMRGDKSARTTVVAGDKAYGQLNLPVNDASPAQMDPVCVGFFFKIASAGTWESSDSVTLVRFYNGAVEAGYLLLSNAAGVTTLHIAIKGLVGTDFYLDTQALTVGTEYYIRLVCNWTAGTMTLYIDDSERGTATVVPADGTKAPDRFYVGAHYTFNTPTIALDIDRFGIGDRLTDVGKRSVFSTSTRTRRPGKSYYRRLLETG